MSCVVAQVTDGGVEIAADSISVRSWTQRKGDHSTFSKLTEINDMVIGGAGKMSEVGAFFVFTATHRPAQASESAIMEYLAEFSEWKKKRMNNADLGAAYLIWLEGTLWHIGGWCVEQIRTFEAIGAGKDYALAAMHLGHSVEEAVNVAIELSIYCEGPVQVIKKTA